MRPICWLLAAAALCACAGRQSPPAQTPPPLLIDERGTTMPFEQAVTHLSFRSYVPSSQVLAYAVLPPLGGADTDANRGLGVEYVAGSDAFLLSEWPKQHFAVAFGQARLGLEPCTPVHYSAQAVAWTTPSNLVLTLQPDGMAPAAAVDREAHRLVRAGACRY